jgi:hypothetical protein
VSEENIDEFSLPALGEPTTQRIRTRTNRAAQTIRGVIQTPYDADEYYSRNSYDFISERRITGITGVVTVSFGVELAKVIWIYFPTSTQESAITANRLLFRLDGESPGNAVGTPYCYPGEGRSFVVPMLDHITISVDSGNGVARITWGW